MLLRPWLRPPSRGGVLPTAVLALALGVTGCTASGTEAEPEASGSNGSSDQPGPSSAGTDASGRTGPTEPTERTEPTEDPDEITDEDFAEVGRLLAARAEALRSGNRRAFVRTLDPENPGLRRRQLVYFDNLQDLPVQKFYYGMENSGLVPDEVRGDDPTMRPPVFEHVRLRGFNQRPVSNQVSLTFVERDGRWVVGREEVDETFESQARPWYGRRIDVASGTSGDTALLTLTDDGAALDADDLLDAASSALSRVVGVLDDSSDTPLVIDATSNGLATELSNASGEDAGAVFFQTYATTRAGEDYTGEAGSAVKVNPDAVAELAGNDYLLRHELTHFVLAAESVGNPIWVTEGIAEYVAAQPGLLAGSVLQDDALLRRITARDVELIGDGRWGDDPAVDYLSAQAFTEFLVQRSGLDDYRRLMAQLRRGAATTYGDQGVEQALEDVYGLTPDEVAEGGFVLLEGLGD